MRTSVAIRPQDLAQRRDLRLRIVLFDRSARPNMAHQCVRRGGAPCPIAAVQMPGMGGLDLYPRSTTSCIITTHRDDGARERALFAGVIGLRGQALWGG